jgi:hypothetical protein
VANITDRIFMQTSVLIIIAMPYWVKKDENGKNKNST